MTVGASLASLPTLARRTGATDHSPSGAVEETAAHPEGYAPLGSVSVPGAMEAVVGDDGAYAYLAVNDGFAVVDLSDPTAPTVAHEERGILADHEDGPLPNVQDVKVAGDRLLVAGPANGGQDDLRAAALYDVADPTDPRLLDTMETGFIHHNVYLDGRYAYLSGLGRPGSPMVVVDTAGGRLREVAQWSPADVDER